MLNRLSFRRLARAIAARLAGACTVPPPGWRCTRSPGHAGPCAALPDQAPAPVLDMNRVAVLLPGDTLIVSYPNRLNVYQREQIVAAVREQLPLNKVAIIDGVTAVAIARGDA